MNEFILRDIKICSENELLDIGFDKSYVSKAVDKYKFKNIKIFNLSMPQANILKQTALSVGADCAVHKELITGKIEKTDCILGGSYSQLKKIAQKLKNQPFRLKELGELILNNIEYNLSPLIIKGKEFDFKKPYLVGVLNLTQNSFSDGGEYFEFDSAIKHLHELIDDGADIIDIGAESTKPFSDAVSADNQLQKLLPILDYIKLNDIQIPVSIDTRSSKVAQKCIESGADIINDVSGLDYDSEMVDVLAKKGVLVVIQHSQGSPENMQINPKYDSLIDDIYYSLSEKIDFAISKGVKRENIIVDLGIGFGKSREQNFELLKRLEEFKSLYCPIMLGVSRKSLLDMQNCTNEEKDMFTLALNSSLIDSKVNFLRVHNVKIHKQLLDMKFL